VCVLEDWWPTIRDLTLCWQFCSERHSKRQYERWNKILYGQQWKKKKKSRRFLRIEDFIFYLSTRNSVLSRGIHWVSWGSIKHQNLSYHQNLLSDQTYSAHRLDSRGSGRICPASQPYLRLSQPYSAPYSGFRDLTRTCSTPSPNISGLSALSWITLVLFGFLAGF
jgi:hypothetical protein